jgi:molybdopterin synthase sulfur carrier subunit
MVVRVLYFAGLRDAIGVGEESLDLPDAVTTVGELCTHLAARHGAYASRRPYVRVARNECFASEDERLVQGDVVAFIPPVAGG